MKDSLVVAALLLSLPSVSYGQWPTADEYQRLNDASDQMDTERSRWSSYHIILDQRETHGHDAYDFSKTGDNHGLERLGL